jgi:murein peptide amidase A
MIPSGGTYPELVRRWEALHDGGRVRVGHVETRRAGRTLLCIEVGDRQAPLVAIAAGVHGDEPAGAWALLGLMEDDELDARCSYRIWPCTNPSGFAARTRQSADGVDVNRTFGGVGASPEASAILAANRGLAFALSLDLHEDCDAGGFYCYEYGGGQVGRRVIAALEGEGLPIDPLEVTFGLAGPLDDAGCTRERGRIIADALEEAALLGGLSYSLALARAGARHAVTFETPLSAAWGTRLATHRVAVLAAVEALLEESACMPLK